MPKERKEARRGPAAEHSVQASLDPAGITLDVEVATDISLGGDPRECCEARVQSRNSAAQNRSPAHLMPTQLQVPSQMHAQKPIPEHSATSRDQEQVTPSCMHMHTSGCTHNTYNSNNCIKVANTIRHADTHMPSCATLALPHRRGVARAGKPAEGGLSC